MPAYVIADVNVTDAKGYEDYRAQVLATVTKYGGRFVVRGGNPEGLEGGWSPSRIVVLEFADKAAAKAWYNSPEYKPLIAMRQHASKGSLILVDGV